MAEQGSVVVVGGTHGLGLEVAKHFAGQGRDVVVTGRDNARAKTVAKEIGGRTRGIGFDLARPAEIAPALKDTGPIQYLVLAAIERQVDAVRGGVGQQENNPIDDILHRRQPPGRRLRPYPLQDLGGLCAPVGAVAHDPRMDRVDAHGSQLHDQRSDQATDARVDSGHDRRAAVGLVLRLTAKNQDGAVRPKPWVKRVNDFGVADQLERHET